MLYCIILFYVDMSIESIDVSLPADQTTEKSGIEVTVDAIALEGSARNPTLRHKNRKIDDGKREKPVTVTFSYFVRHVGLEKFLLSNSKWSGSTDAIYRVDSDERQPLE